MQVIAAAYQQIFKNYINSNPSSLIGDVKRINQYFNMNFHGSDIPMIYVDYLSSNSIVYSGYTEVDAEVQIGYVEAAKHVSGSSNIDVFELKKKIVTVIEGIDTDKTVKEDSILGIVRNNTGLSYESTNMAVDVINYRTEYRTIGEENIEYMEGIVTATVKVILSN